MRARDQLGAHPVARPQLAHFLGSFEQFAEGALVLHLAVCQEQDLICAAQSGVAVRDRDARQIPPLQEPLPEEPLRLDVECARQVIDHQ